MESGRVSASHVLVEKRYGIRERLAACHMNLQAHWRRDAFYLKTQGKWTQRMRQDYCEAHFLRKRRGMWARSTASHTKNLQSPWTQEALSLKKHMESGRVCATHVLVEKRYGIGQRLAACHMNLQSQWTHDAFYPRKHKESGGVGATRIFIEKHKESAGVGHPWHINSQSKWSLGAIYTVYTTISAWGGGVY